MTSRFHSLCRRHRRLIEYAMMPSAFSMSPRRYAYITDGDALLDARQRHAVFWCRRYWCYAVIAYAFERAADEAIIDLPDTAFDDADAPDAADADTEYFDIAFRYFLRLRRLRWRAMMPYLICAYC